GGGGGGVEGWGGGGGWRGWGGAGRVETDDDGRADRGGLGDGVGGWNDTGREQPDLLEPDRHPDPDGTRAQCQEPKQQGQREPQPVFVADLRSRENRHESAVGGREQLAQPAAVLISEHGHLARQAEQVGDGNEDR